MHIKHTHLQAHKHTHTIYSLQRVNTGQNTVAITVIQLGDPSGVFTGIRVRDQFQSRDDSKAAAAFHSDIMYLLPAQIHDLCFFHCCYMCIYVLVQSVESI